jgi:hypothetical protein
MLDAIADHYGDVVALAYTQGQQSVGQLIDPRVQLAVSDFTETVCGGELGWGIRGATAQAVAHQ